MKTSTKQAGNFRPVVGRIALALTTVLVMGGLAVTPVFGKDDHRDGARGDHRGNRDWRAPQPGYYPRARYYGHPYYYSYPVYVPAPVYYPPQPSPGLNLFFPLDVRIR